MYTTKIMEEVQNYTKEIIKNYSRHSSSEIIEGAQNLLENLLISRLTELLDHSQEKIEKVTEIDRDLLKIDDYVEFSKITMNIKFSYLIDILNSRFKQINKSINK